MRLFHYAHFAHNADNLLKTINNNKRYIYKREREINALNTSLQIISKEPKDDPELQILVQTL